MLKFHSFQLIHTEIQLENKKSLEEYTLFTDPDITYVHIAIGVWNYENKNWYSKRYSTCARYNAIYWYKTTTSCFFISVAITCNHLPLHTIAVEVSTT